MKINEPKTPYTRRYDPAEDEEEDEGGEMQVDGVMEEMALLDEIPGLDLGEPAEALPAPVREDRVTLEEGGGEVGSRPSTRGRRDSAKQVVVEEATLDKEPEMDGMVPVDVD
jgi:Protein phosphatase inhibitor 2 (IPP-2)